MLPATTYAFIANTPRAKNWLDEHCPDAMSWGVDGIVVEWRYARDIAIALEQAGLRGEVDVIS